MKQYQDTKEKEMYMLDFQFENIHKHTYLKNSIYLTVARKLHTKNSPSTCCSKDNLDIFVTSIYTSNAVQKWKTHISVP